MLPLLVTSMVSFISLPLFLRYLGTEMYALWGYVAVLSGMFGFADMGLGSAVGRYVGVALGRNDPAAMRGYWGTGNMIMLPFLALMSLVFALLGAWLGPKWFNVLPENALLLRWCFVAGGLGLFFGYYGAYWLVISQAFLDFKFISATRIVMTLLQIIPGVMLAWLTRNPLFVTAWGTLVLLLQLVVLVWHARRKYDVGFQFQEASLMHAREMATYTGKNLIVLVVGSFFVSIDRVMLGRFAPAQSFSPYVFSSNVATRLQGLSSSVMAPVMFNTTRVVEDARTAAARIYNETFGFVFEWYLLAAIWLGVWHPVLLRLWLTHTMGARLGMETAAQVGPLLVPLVAAGCLGAMANISTAQLASLNRLGVTIICTAAAGGLAVAGVWIGWNTFGVVGVAYGFLFSRIALVAQDLFAIHLLKAGGWLDIRTWWMVAAQGLVGGIFALIYLFLPGDSLWLLVPAALHAGLVGGWLLRGPLTRLLKTSNWR